MTPAWLRAAWALRRVGWALAAPALRWRHRGAAVVHGRPLAEAQPRALEGYPGQLWAPSGRSRAFHLRSPHDANTLTVQRYAGWDSDAEDGQRFETVARVPFGRSQPETPPDAPAAGAGWPATLTLDTAGWPQGTYRATVEAPGAHAETVRQSAVTFLVGPAEPSARVAVLAPVTTWLAYNPWGGQSLYHNEHGHGERGPEPTVWAHAHRPNPALDWSPVGAMHAMAAEAPAFDWIHRQSGADLVPDWMLEHPERLDRYSVLVLAYHCEYASDAMLDGLDRLVAGGRSLLALGGNQLYWRVRWDAGHTRVECRKDGSRFADGARGGLWRRRGRPEDRALGVRFTPPGTGTYAPYRVEDAGHWLLAGAGVADGDLFGHRGTTPLPICGDETDEPGWLSAPHRPGRRARPQPGTRHRRRLHAVAPARPGVGRLGRRHHRPHAALGAPRRAGDRRHPQPVRPRRRPGVLAHRGPLPGPLPILTPRADGPASTSVLTRAPTNPRP